MKKLKTSSLPIGKENLLTQDEKKNVNGGYYNSWIVGGGTIRYRYCSCGGQTIVLNGHECCPVGCIDTTGGGQDTWSPIAPTYPGIF